MSAGRHLNDVVLSDGRANLQKRLGLLAEKSAPVTGRSWPACALHKSCVDSLVSLLDHSGGKRAHSSRCDAKDSLGGRKKADFCRKTLNLIGA